jgi:hypothetical protein
MLHRRLSRSPLPREELAIQAILSELPEKRGNFRGVGRSAARGDRRGLLSEMSLRRLDRAD